MEPGDQAYLPLPPADDVSPPSGPADAAPDSSPASQPAPSSQPVSTPAPASTPTAASPASSPDAAPSSSPSSTPAPAASSPAPASDDPPPSSAPSSTPPDSGGCAEIPAAPHAVLTAAISLLVQIPLATDAARQLPDKLTLTSDDGSVSQTLALASDCQPGDTDGTSVLTFKELAEHHTYSLEHDDGTTTYVVFKDVPYDQVVAQLGASGTAASASSPSGGSPGGS